MATWTEQHAPKPGDLIFIKDPDTGEVFTDLLWTIVENEGPVKAEDLADSMPWATYWTVRASCDNRCKARGISGCYFPCPHSLMLSADDFVLVVNV
jgi:hypothetical protein